MRKEYKAVVWVSKSKTAVEYKMIETDGKRKYTRFGTVNRFKLESDKKIVSRGFSEIVDSGWTLERIDEETDKNLREREAQLKDQERARKESADYEKVRKLFQTKIEIFQIEDIQNSKDIQSQREIRKAKTPTEAITLAALLLMKERNANDENDSEDTDSKE